MSGASDAEPAVHQPQEACADAPSAPAGTRPPWSSGSDGAGRRIALPRSVWKAREAAHRCKVGPLTTDWLERAGRGLKHPVWDFLFTYYRFKPGRLLTWVPGILRAEDGGAEEGLAGEPDPVVWDAPPVPGRVRALARWVAGLCEAMLARPARFHCYALHEWAMVYGQTAADVRHQGWSLRLEPEAVAHLVESQPLACTHYDAFRFFTPSARPLNQGVPTRETCVAWEQSGCLHANMDLYKWAAKLWPWIGSDLVGDAFVLAAQGRAVDMRSSPYDLRALGFEPIRIETEDGREQFREEQQALARAAEPVRRRLLAAAQELGSARLPLICVPT